MLASAEVRVADRVYSLVPGTLSAGPLAVEFRSALHGEKLEDWTVFLTNPAEKNSPRVTGLKGLSLRLPLAAEEAVLFSTLRGDDCSAESFRPEVFSLSVGDCVVREPLGGRSSNTTAFPYFDIAFPKRTLVFGLGWSGQWRLTLTREQDALYVEAGQSELDTILYPGESIRSVRVLAYETSSDPVHARQEFVALHRKYVSPARVHGESFSSPIAVQCFDRYFWGENPAPGEAPYFETEQAQVKLCEAAGKCGTFDTHWVDACWYKNTFRSGVGNYLEYSVGFPRGMKAVSEEAHRNGMRFLVWFEPMRAMEGTEVWKKYENEPEKLIRLPGNGHALVNLGDPEVRQWMLDKISEVMEESGIDSFREDFNIDPLDYLRSIEPENRKGMAQMRFVEGLYQLWDDLRARFPGLLIDNCSSGGRNLDVETCSRALSLWQSDTACRPNLDDETDCALVHQNQHRALSRYLPYHQASSFTADAYTMRSSGTYGISCEFDFLSDSFDVPAARAAVEEVRRLSRYWEGNFTALTEFSLSEAEWCVWTLQLSPEEGMLTALRRPGAPETFRVCIPDLLPDREYEVTFLDDGRTETVARFSGQELSEDFELKIPKAPGSLVLLWK